MVVALVSYLLKQGIKPEKESDCDCVTVAVFDGWDRIFSGEKSHYGCIDPSTTWHVCSWEPRLLCGLLVIWRQLATDMYDKGFADSLLPIRCQRHGNLQKIEHPSEFATKSPEGGCLEICDAELPCSHKCPRRCHPNDDHDSWKCTQECLRTCKDERYRHPCQRRCFEPCGDCAHVVKIRLKCGHFYNVLLLPRDMCLRHERCKKCLAVNVFNLW
ncbi:hypothetical protein OSTOST_03620 [Ostertagia ostertagi]